MDESRQLRWSGHAFLSTALSKDSFDQSGAWNGETAEHLRHGAGAERRAARRLRPADPSLPELTEDEHRLLLDFPKREKLVELHLDSEADSGARALLAAPVEDQLQEKYDQPLYTTKCDAVYQHVCDSYRDDGHSIYDAAA